MQTKKVILSVAALALLGILPAKAAGSALGRITFIYRDGHHLIIDSSKEYNLAPSVNRQPWALPNLFG